ncbi:hypothetical protein [Varibaculum cambriense]|uniref:Uncharacterized protein n=1 Tax=Varibaculum cambriense TaxID=184870 RepID=A0AAJ1BBH3_9ACTO|nr:hypothetical protein [Varibaculum cambriense]
MTSKKKLLDDACNQLWTIESYQNEIISCIQNAGFDLYELKDVLEDFPREFDESKEKLSNLLEAAYQLEGWAIGHHQVIQELGEIMTKIEKPQNRKPGGKK